MLARTHIAFGILAYLISINFLKIDNAILFLMALVFFSIFADIDCYTSKIGKRTKPISYLINFFLEHRGIFHTIYMPILIYILLGLLNSDLANAAVLGYGSHILLDSITFSGTAPFYPLFNKKISGFIKTGSFFENLLFIVIIAICLHYIL